jgi:hypothetical protein
VPIIDKDAQPTKPETISKTGNKITTTANSTITNSDFAVFDLVIVYSSQSKNLFFFQQINNSIHRMFIKTICNP